MANKTYGTIDEYISTFPKDVQTSLQKIRSTIHATAPGVTETISYNIPTLNLNGEYLVYFAAWKTYISMYPLPSGDDAFQAELARYETTKGSVHFPLDQPMPYNFIEKLVRFRVLERTTQA